MSRSPYHERPDLEKIRSQWRKLTGLRKRKEWSASVVRAATVAELSLNLAIRQEFAARSTLSDDFINDLLKWANGLSGKLNHLLLPLLRSEPERLQQAKPLIKIADQINQKRNAVVHQGEFCNEDEARTVLEHAERLVNEIVGWYEPGFTVSTDTSVEKKHD